MVAEEAVAATELGQCVRVARQCSLSRGHPLGYLHSCCSGGAEAGSIVRCAHVACCVCISLAVWPCAGHQHLNRSLVAFGGFMVYQSCCSLEVSCAWHTVVTTMPGHVFIQQCMRSCSLRACFAWLVHVCDGLAHVLPDLVDVASLKLPAG